VDNLTHTLFAVTLAGTPLRRAGGGTTAALILASSAPDIDFVSMAAGAGSYLTWHRGPTHGLLGIVGLGTLTAALVWSGRWARDRWRPVERVPREDVETRAASFGMLVAISIVGGLLHVLMDLATSYGTQLLSPFEWSWYAMDWLPIVDIYLLIVLAVTLAIGRIAPDARHRLAAMALLLMAAEYGFRATMHHQALADAPRLFGPLLPQRCEPDIAFRDATAINRWPRPRVEPPPPGAKPCLVEIAAQPTFTSPFRWRLIAHLSNAYDLREIDLLDRRLHPPETGEADQMWRPPLRYPDQWVPQTMAAAATRTAQRFLGFSRFPAARTYVDPTGAVTVHWSDVRFAGNVFSREAERRPNPFTATVRLDPGGRVLQEQFGQ
jgi:membrane-bound metal-dependent hydrolase YbcI (DUF457 family)